MHKFIFPTKDSWIYELSSSVNYGGYLSDWGGSDYPEMKLIFLDEFGIQIYEIMVIIWFHFA